MAILATALGRWARSGGNKLKLLVVTTRRALVLGLLGVLLVAPWFVRALFPLEFAEEIVTYSKRQRLDPYLVAAVIHVESRFRAGSHSTKGARGLMQVMPETGAWIAEQIGITGFSPDDLYDPEFNIQLGTWYLADLHRTFNGDIVLVLAAYNGGRGNVRRWLQNYARETGKSGFPISEIPFPETRRYVQRVLSTYWIYRLFYPSLGVLTD